MCSDTTDIINDPKTFVFHIIRCRYEKGVSQENDMREGHFRLMYEFNLSRAGETSTHQNGQKENRSVEMTVCWKYVKLFPFNHRNQPKLNVMAAVAVRSRKLFAYVVRLGGSLAKQPTLKLSASEPGLI